MKKYQVSFYFIEEALQSRFDDKFELWGTEAAEELFPQTLDQIKLKGIKDNDTPMAIVDNYLINGQFVDREHDVDNYDLPHDEHGVVTHEMWKEYCRKNAVIFNDKFACLSLGFKL